jgi:hypothetical protein
VSIEAKMREHSVSPSPDKLDALRAMVRKRRDLQAQIADLEDKLSSLVKERTDLDTRVLPNAFEEAGVDRIGLPAEGNHGALDAVLTPFYKASINASWDHRRKDAAFKKLSEMGLDSLVRREVVSDFSPGEMGWKKVVKALEKIGVNFSVRDSVHWKTLTAAVQQLCEEGKHPGQAALEAIGAYVGKVVTIKPRSD